MPAASALVVGRHGVYKPPPDSSTAMRDAASGTECGDNVTFRSLRTRGAAFTITESWSEETASSKTSITFCIWKPIIFSPNEQDGADSTTHCFLVGSCATSSL